MEVGHSNPTSSHDNPALHGTPPSSSSSSLPANSFHIDCIEVWRVSFPPETGELDGEAPNSASRSNGQKAGVLDAFKEEKNFLSLAGKQMHSEGLR